MPDLRPNNVLQAMYGLAFLCAVLIVALLALQPIDNVSGTLQTRLIVGLILVVPGTGVVMLILNWLRPDGFYNPWERSGKSYGDQDQPQTRIQVMKKKATPEANQLRLPGGEPPKLDGPKQ